MATTKEGIRDLIARGMRDHYCVRMKYYTEGRGATSVRVVEPLHDDERYEWGGVFRAYCRKRKEERSFAYKNVRRAELLAEKFEPPSHAHKPGSEQPPIDYGKPLRRQQPSPEVPPPKTSQAAAPGCLVAVFILILCAIALATVL